jgi:phytoene synthase
VALDLFPSRVRPAFTALWSLDLAFADVVATSTQPALGAVRMAWWRERLEALDSDARPPDEPRLKAVAEQLVPRGVSGAELSHLEDAWLPMLEAFPWRAEVAAGLRLRGTILFAAGARLLGGDPDAAAGAGALWSLVDGARHCSDVHSRIYLMDEARREIAILPPTKPPKAVRRLTALAAIAAHDVMRNQPLELPHADSGRGMAALLHQWRGTLPRG